MAMQENGRVGIYVRESRDENGENYETIKNQRELLLDYALKHSLGAVYSVYEDDNVSGSGFERSGLARLKEDVMNTKIDLLLVKDLSRLGRNNAKTLQFLDFLEEYGIRVLSSDGRYDSRLGDDIVGIETWANERYIRDISRKIRSSLRFKIQRGEYVGHAPFGYKKVAGKGNRLFIDVSRAETVRTIYRLYLSGLGYSAIAAMLEEDGHPSPGGGGWNRITVRRILVSPVYRGDTVQGVSEKVSFKSKKTRRLPKEDWVITEGTHEAIISKEEFRDAQKLRECRKTGKGPHKGVIHTFHGLIWCGGCGSAMYARKRAGGIAYICGSYCRNGRKACTSHFVYERELSGVICGVLTAMFSADGYLHELEQQFRAAGSSTDLLNEGVERKKRLLAAYRKQQDMLYTDRLEGRISGQLFERMNRVLEDRLHGLEAQTSVPEPEMNGKTGPASLIDDALKQFVSGKLTNEIAGAVVNRVTVYDPGDSLPEQFPGNYDQSGGTGAVVIEFRMK